MKWLVKKSKATVQGREHSYNSVSESKIAKMMELNYQKRTEAKIKWAVKCYNDWRAMRLDRVDRSDLNIVESLKKDSFEFALCRFICEIKKVNSNEDYPGRTLYQMVCAIQNHLRKNICDWKGWLEEVISLEFENTLSTKGVSGRIPQISLETQFCTFLV